MQAAPVAMPNGTYTPFDQNARLNPFWELYRPGFFVQSMLGRVVWLSGWLNHMNVPMEKRSE